MEEKIKVVKVVKHEDGYSIRVPIAFARKLGMTGGYVNVCLAGDSLLIEKTFMNSRKEEEENVEQA